MNISITALSKAIALLTPEYGDNNGKREERLLYILYDFSSDFVNKRYKHELI